MPDVNGYLKKFGSSLLCSRLIAGRDMLVAVFLVFSVIILIVPMNASIMDFLLAINITFSLVLLLTTVYVARPLDLSVFPTMLLMATLYRLCLNIATTRLILGNAKEEGTFAAGKIVAAFGSFVGGQSLPIGATIFVIIIIIQFVVITKGATRISEVAARFTLDAMPGQQMAIDADLNAGLIDEGEARQRRDDLRRQTDFYGSMDGASKFVRGDAIAGIIITLINIIVGLVIGRVIYDMSFSEATEVFTLLTIGDGLVSQVPALLVSVAAGLLVTRSTERTNLSQDIIRQIFGQRKAVGMAGVLILGLGISGFFGLPFPSFPLILIGTSCSVVWYVMGMSGAATEKGRQEAVAAQESAATAAAAKEPDNVEHLLQVDPMSLEVGYGLVPLVDVGQAGGGGLLGRVQMIRRQIASELGIVVPPIRIRDDIRLDVNEYIIKIHGGTIARGIAIPDRYLAMDSGMVTEPIEGMETTEPAFGLPAVWVMENQKEQAERQGYTVVDAETVVATHLTEVIKSRSHEILTREEVRRLINGIRQRAGELVDEVIRPELLSIADVQKVLQNLLRERVSIKNLEAILEVLGDYGRRTKDPEILTEYARNSLARWICSEYAEGENTLYVVTMDPRLEEQIQQSIEHTEGGSFLTIRPQQMQAIVASVSNALNSLLTAGHQAILLTSPQIRAQMKRMTDSSIPMLIVLSYNEILSEYNVESMGMAKLEEEKQAVTAGGENQ